jgi:hypothetical protein
MTCAYNKLLFFLSITYLNKALDLGQRSDDVTTKKENVTTKKENVTKRKDVSKREDVTEYVIRKENVTHYSIKVEEMMLLYYIHST